MENYCMHEEKDLSEKPLTPKTPPKRVQLRPKLTYSRRRFKEKKFSHIPLSIGFSLQNDDNANNKLKILSEEKAQASTVGPETTTPGRRADVADKPILFSCATTPLPHQDNEQTKRNVVDIGIGNFPYTTTPTKTDTNSNKREKESSDTNERPKKKPKKKIHRPKVIGEGKRRLPKEPKTPKTTTPKSKNISGQVNSEKVNRAIVSCRRSLHFDEMGREVLGEDRSNVAREDEKNVPLLERYSNCLDRSNVAREDEKSVPLLERYSNCFDRSIVAREDEKNVPLLERYSNCLAYESLGFPKSVKKKRVMRRFKVQIRDLTLDLKPLVETKRKRSKRSGPKKVPQVACGYEVERDENLKENENIQSDFKSIEYSQDTVKICDSVKLPFFTDFNLPCIGNETSLVDQSRAPECGAIVSHSGLAETVHNADLPIVPVVEQGQGQGQGQLSIVKKNRKQLMLKHYEEEVKAWKFEVKSLGYGNADEEEAKEKLESEREMFRGRIQVFTSCMHRILGDRTFTKWKGSVIDSVIGVFLTQNVSDILSSSAFIDLRAKFPIKSSSTRKRFVGPKLLLHKEPEEEEKDAIDIEDIVPNSQGDSRFSDSCSTFEHNLEEIVKLIGKVKISSSEGKHPIETKETIRGEKKKKNEKANEVKIDWEEVRKKYQRDGKRRDGQEDSVDWEAVRQAPASEIADAIKKRGQHNNIAKRIKEFLDRVVELHKVLDLEWLRDVSADQVQKYLLEFNGLGLKSVECIRLLAIENVAFPVDTNVGRIAVRLGWVPLEPLPEELQLHLLQQYPIMDSIQKYLWPRLCTLDQRQLYELHYHLITFGKVFCTKRNPNCNDCPMKAECKHYASHYASARKALPGPTRKVQSSSPSEVVIHPLPILNTSKYLELSQWQTNTCEPIIEMPQSPEPE